MDRKRTIKEICDNIAEWRAAGRKEIAEFAQHLQDSKRKPKHKKGYIWEFTDRITPLTIYSYLKGRFGNPNGFQTYLKDPNDVDNLIHWDFQIISNDQVLLFTGFTFYFTVAVFDLDDKTENDEQMFFEALTAELKKQSDLIDRVKSELEKWHVFLNPYHHFSDMVYNLEDQLEKIELSNNLKRPTSHDLLPQYTESTKNLSEAFSLGTQLSLIIPIWIESFVNLVIFVLLKPEIRRDHKKHKKVKIEKILPKILSLHLNCIGFNEKVEQSDPVILDITMLYKKRNNRLHGAFEPVLHDPFSVYFDNRTTPLFDRHTYGPEFIHSLLLNEVRLSKLKEEIELGQKFIALILEKLQPDKAEMLSHIMNDSMPGWDDKRMISGSIIPHQFVDIMPVPKED